MSHQVRVDVSALPTGMVTFLFTDIEGSTVRWERSPEQMTRALAMHDAVMHRAIERGSGFLCQTAGDSFVIAFESAPDALLTALAVQRDLRDQSWPAETGPLRVRMALHTGPATRDGDIYDANHTLTRQSRIVAIADAEEILVSNTAHARLVDHLPELVSLVDLGSRWLKDLLEPVRVFRVQAPDPPWSLPDSTAGAGEKRPGDLPGFAQPFIGRGRVVDQLSTIVLGDRQRLATVVGPGGMGKTRLAIQTARSVQHRFSAGVVFVDLAAVTEPDLVMPAIAAALDSIDDVVTVDSLADSIGELDVLLVLDNLEQVIDAAPLIGQLIQNTSAPRFLATSRLPLSLAGERVHELAPLGLPELEVDDVELARAGQSEAMALFVERASVSRPDFVLTESNARAIAGICHRLDGIPLALVLAAARSKILTPGMMLERLDRRLALLTSGGPDLPARHRTLRDTIDWSFELLDENEKTLYARWSVFVGGFRLEAAHAASGSDDLFATLDCLTTLVENSLLTSSETADGEMRYRMLETINEHAGEKLQHGDAVHVVRRAHARHFLDLAEQALPHLEDEHVVRWASRLEEDHDNLRAALSHSFEQIEDGNVEASEVAVRLAAALALFWHDRGHMQEGRVHLETALTAVPMWAESSASAREQATGAAAVMLDYLGSMARRRGDLEAAHRHLDAALDAHQSIDDPRGRGRVLAALGSLLRQEGNIDGARSVINESLDLAQSVDDGFTVVDGLLTLGNIERDLDNSADAEVLYERALESARAIHEFLGMSVALNNIANLAIFADRDLRRARSLHQESLELRFAIGHRIMVAESLLGIAAIEAAHGRHVSAAELIGFADQLAEKVGAEFDPEEQRLYDRTVSALAAELGTERLHRAREAGASLTIDTAIERARSMSEVD